MSLRVSLFLCEAAAVVSFCIHLDAASVRLCFLQNDSVLRDTLALLRENGCAKDAAEKFRQAVIQYDFQHTDFSLKRFPKKGSDGFYLFSSSKEAASALPHKLCDTAHEYELNCFDTVILLAQGFLTTAANPNEVCEPLMIPRVETNDLVTFVAAVTPADGFVALYPEWYRDRTRRYFDAAAQSRRAVLSTALFTSNYLPHSTTERDVGPALLHQLQSYWKRREVRFPKDMEIVLCQNVRLAGYHFWIPHAGLLLRRSKGFTYLEKSGGAGPFVRLDIEQRDDLLHWLEAMFEREIGYSHYFVTFNDQAIHQLRIDLAQP